MKASSLAGTPNFGSANAASDMVTIVHSTMSTVTTPTMETMDRLDGYLDNLALEVTGEKAVYNSSWTAPSSP